jgi:hypothetical protein
MRIGVGRQSRVDEAQRGAVGRVERRAAQAAVDLRGGRSLSKAGRLALPFTPAVPLKSGALTSVTSVPAAAGALPSSNPQ